MGLSAPPAVAFQTNVQIHTNAIKNVPQTKTASPQVDAAVTVIAHKK